MKGPYERLKYDLRRVWECPICKHRERTNGDVSSMLCKCQEREPADGRAFMKLVEDGIRPVSKVTPTPPASTEPASTAPAPPEASSALATSADPESPLPQGGSVI